MKKILSLLLLLSIIFSSGVFAADPSPASFDITTNVTGVNLMKFTSIAVATKEAFEDSSNDWTTIDNTVVAGSTALPVDNTFHDIAYISTMSNDRNGFTVSMSASAMKSTTSGGSAYINYSVAIDDDNIATTNGATNNAEIAEVISNGSLSTLKVQSAKISIKVDKAGFDAAVQGEYSGEVTFTFTSNS